MIVVICRTPFQATLQQPITAEIGSSVIEHQVVVLLVIFFNKEIVISL